MGCSRTKICFSEQEAEKVLELAAKSGKQYRREKRKYYCRNCNAWHVTSEEFDEGQRKIKSKFKQHWKQFIGK